MLRDLTVLINFVGLCGAVWLGLYVLTRNPRNLIPWLTGLTLWFISGLFWNVLLSLNPPPDIIQIPPWSYFLFPFWPTAKIISPSGWLEGWTIIPAIAAWHHVTTLMRPGRSTYWRWIRISAAYLIGGSAIYFQNFTPLLFTSTGGDPLYLNALRPGLLYPFYAFWMLVFSAVSVINLVRTTRETPYAMPRKQLNLLASATIIAGLVGPLSLLPTLFGIPVPMALVTLPLVIAVGLIGFGIARYSALMEGRTMQRDFAYSAVAISLVILVYWLAARGMVRLLGLPSILATTIVVLAIVTHSLVTNARRLLDRFFYQERTARLRSNLSSLSRMAGEEEGLKPSLALSLSSLCSSVRAKYGLIVVFNEDGREKMSAVRWSKSVAAIPKEALLGDDVRGIDPGELPAPFEEAALNIPLYADLEQFGAIVLGQPENGIRYSPEDIDRLLEPGDQIGATILHHQKIRDYIKTISSLELPATGQSLSYPAVPTKDVENAFRHLHDLSYLGESPLTELYLVRKKTPSGAVSHIDRGKILRETLLEQMEKLRPEDTSPREPPPREWHPYLILHNAYVEDQLNREIMARLYISEGTFNRTRRSAIRSVSKSLGEMEAYSISAPGD